ncbi:MAG: DUF4301 family protein [Bacteroidetes bacterium]|nr:DUF4301 family protein [Bacteroidota bacterium]MCL1968031.1 DUF4301 family protein [Bacteroidota bacterium]
MLNFFSRDLNFMAQRGSNPEQVEKQFSFFNTGFDFAHIARNVTIGNGIVKFSEKEIQHWIDIYELKAKNKEIVKFVPASGAASRMFKDLYDALLNENPNEKAKLYVDKIRDFAFFEDLKKTIEKNRISFDEVMHDETSKIPFEYLLEEKGLNYGNLPKGLLKFHKYANETRTALEEHLVESALYAKSGDDVCRLHFTVSPNHLEKFEELVAEVKDRYEQRFGITYQITYSIQEPSTDTLAAELDNTPFRDKNGDLLFRPGGHGALIENLNKIHADLVFVKNIDNVTTEDNLKPTLLYKKALAGYLFYLQEKSFNYQEQLIDNQLSNDNLKEIIDFAENELFIQFENEKPTPEKVLQKLHRPMRICGVVKNEGEPGGGPFWVTNRKGETSLQIVESSQIDKSNPQQKDFMTSASHFNPVDMFCCYKDISDKFFNLVQYVDPYTGFISEKSYEGRILKAMELPGLWNGAMADWITVFVEVPLSTFNPVKTVFDLLR